MLDPRDPRSELLLVSVVSVFWRLVIGMLSAAMIAWIIDETLRPL
jgi:hypothetical protein